MLAIFNTTSILFITILLGFIAGISGLFKRGQDQTLINYVFYIALPLSLFLSCYHAKWQIFNPGYLISYSLSMVVIITLTWFINNYGFKFSIIDSQINSLAVSQVDGAYFTMPLFMLIFNSTAMAVPLMLLQNIVFFTLGLVLIQLSSEKGQTTTNQWVFVVHRLWHVLIHNPIISLSLLGLIANLTHFELPQIIEHPATFIGKTASAVALFSLGLTCAFNINSFTQLRQIVPLVTLGTLKLIIFPLVALVIGYCFNLSHNLLLALVLLTASPAATHTYIIANKYEANAQIATFNVVTTTLLSFITINLWLYWLN